MLKTRSLNNKSLIKKFTDWFARNISTMDFFKKIIKLAFPVYIISIISVLVNIIDSTMIAPFGTDKLASINAANEVNFFAVATIMGFLQMGFIYFTQYHGKNKTSFEVKSTLTITVYMTIFWTFILILIVEFFSKNLLNIFLHDEKNIEVGSKYIKLISYSWFFHALVLPITWGLARIGKPFFSIFVSLTSLVVNVVLNYLYIHGIGVPKLDVTGVALSTLISRVCELGVGVTILIIFRIKEYKGFLLPIYWSNKIFKKIISKWVLLINEALWVSSLIFQVALTSTRGDDAIATIGSAHVVVQILFATHASFSAVMAYFVGRSLGANKLKEAKELSNKIFKLIIFIAFIYSLCFAIISYGIVKSYNASSSTTMEKSTFELYLLITILLLCFMNTSFTSEVVCINALWAGGKVGMAFLGDVLTNWIINAVGALAVFFTDIHFLAIYAILVLSDGFKSFTLYFFYLHYSWVRNITDKEKHFNPISFVKTNLKKILLKR